MVIAPKNRQAKQGGRVRDCQLFFVELSNAVQQCDAACLFSVLVVAQTTIAYWNV